MNPEEAKQNVHYWIEDIENTLYAKGIVKASKLKSVGKVLEPILVKAKSEWCKKQRINCADMIDYNKLNGNINEILNAPEPE